MIFVAQNREDGKKWCEGGPLLILMMHQLNDDGDESRCKLCEVLCQPDTILTLQLREVMVASSFSR